MATLLPHEALHSIYVRGRLLEEDRAGYSREDENEKEGEREREESSFLCPLPSFPPYPCRPPTLLTVSRRVVLISPDVDGFGYILQQLRGEQPFLCTYIQLLTHFRVRRLRIYIVTKEAISPV